MLIVKYFTHYNLFFFNTIKKQLLGDEENDISLKLGILILRHIVKLWNCDLVEAEHLLDQMSNKKSLFIFHAIYLLSIILRNYQYFVNIVYNM